MLSCYRNYEHFETRSHPNFPAIRIWILHKGHILQPILRPRSTRLCLQCCFEMSKEQQSKWPFCHLFEQLYPPLAQKQNAWCLSTSIEQASEAFCFGVIGNATAFSPTFIWNIQASVAAHCGFKHSASFVQPSGGNKWVVWAQSMFVSVCNSNATPCMPSLPEDFTNNLHSVFWC